MCLLAASWVATVTAASAHAQAPAESEPQARRVVLRGVKFGFASAKLDEGSLVVLELAAQYLVEHPDVRLRITGHTSAAGPEGYNQRLSLKRAAAVRQALIGYGVGPERLFTAGRGESEPIASNRTREGRALNRRVELTVVDGPEAAKWSKP